MKNSEDRIKLLEKSILDDFRWGTTKIDSNCLTNTEHELFNHIFKTGVPSNKEKILESPPLISKCNYYMIRRGLDMFMLNMNPQLFSYEEKNMFWFNFTEFVLKTMFFLHRSRGIKFLKDEILGENPEDWPKKFYDPRWKEKIKAEKKWCKDFKEFWDYYYYPTVEKIVSILPTSIPLEVKDQQKTNSYLFSAETLELRQYSFYADIISELLTSLSIIDVYTIVMLSLTEKSKPLLEILKEKETEQKELEKTSC